MMSVFMHDVLAQYFHHEIHKMREMPPFIFVWFVVNVLNGIGRDARSLRKLLRVRITH
jgi:hypothetical protein